MKFDTKCRYVLPGMNILFFSNQLHVSNVMLPEDDQVRQAIPGSMCKILLLPLKFGGYVPNMI